MKVRKIHLQDIHNILQIANEVREHHREFLCGYFLPQDDEMEAEIIAKTISSEKNICLLAEEEDCVLGFILSSFSHNIWLENPKVITINNFGVRKDMRRLGIGQKLMAAFYVECKEMGIQEIKLGVFNKNKSAYAFYENMGFEPQEQKMSLKLK